MDNLIYTVLVIMFGFFLGSIPFAVWLGKIFLGTDIRNYGDHNPGTFNVFRAGGKLLGVLVLFLEVGKGLVPVSIAYRDLGIRGLGLILVILSPVIGHAFSPFLKFKGGKAVAATLGVWGAISAGTFPALGLTPPIPVFGLIVISFMKFFLGPDGWLVMFFFLSNFIVGWFIGIWKEIELLVAFLLNWILLAYTHREEIKMGIYLKKKNPRF